MDDLREAVMGQARKLAGRVRKCGAESYAGGIPAQVLHWFHVGTGELVVALSVRDLVYWETGPDLIVQRERAGRLAWTRVDETTGKPIEPWEEIAPPPSRSALN